MSKGAIIKAPRDHQGFVSPIFLTPKADRSWRPVVNRVFQPTQAGFPGVLHRLAGHDVIPSPRKAALAQDVSSTGALIKSGEGTSPCQFAGDVGGSTPCNPPCPPKLPHSGEGNNTVSQEGCNIQGSSGGPTSHRPTTEAHCGSSSGTGQLREMHH